MSTAVSGIGWVNAAKVTLGGVAWTFTGSLICPNQIVVDNAVTIDNDTLLENLSVPEFAGWPMRIISGSFREVWP